MVLLARLRDVNGFALGRWLGPLRIGRNQHPSARWSSSEGTERQAEPDKGSDDERLRSRHSAPQVNGGGGSIRDLRPRLNP